MDRCGERRRIREVRVLEVFQDSAHVDAHDRDVHHLVHLARSEYLHTKQFSRCTVRDQLCDEEGCVRIIVCLVIRGHKHCLHIVSRFSRLRLSQSGAAHIQPRELYDACAEHTRIRLLRA